MKEGVRQGRGKEGDREGGREGRRKIVEGAWRREESREGEEGKERKKREGIEEWMVGLFYPSFHLLLSFPLFSSFISYIF